MKNLMVILLVAMFAAPAMASRLDCRGKTANVFADFDGRAQRLTRITVYVHEVAGAKFFSAGVLDPTYRPRNPEREMVRYRFYNERNVQTDVSLLLPKAKSRAPFKGVLVGIDHEYHGQATYDVMTCRLVYE